MHGQHLSRLNWTVGLAVFFSLVLLAAPSVLADSGAAFISQPGRVQHPPVIPWLGGPATSLEFSGAPTQTLAGASVALTVTLRDSVGDIATEYTGTLQFSSSDP